MLLITFLSILSLVVSQTLPPSLQDELYLTVPQIIAKYNYSVEVHNVTTEDGYILSLHRILPKKQKKKGSVLVMHGIVASSADWIITGPQQGFGYILSDEGYDVWLGNARGNRYSKNHVTLNPDDAKFWDFSWHEIGIFDLPAMVDHILETTKQEQIFYVGHSQGTTAFYVMCSTRPEYNGKIRAHFSLAPVAYVQHMFSPILRILAHQQTILEHVTNWIDLEEMLPKGGFISILGEKFCGVNKVTKMLCSNSLFAIVGFNAKQLNTTILPLILAHVPAGSSAKQMLHFAQEILSGHFRQYDYGIWNNLKRYHSLKPPDYDLRKITAPLYFFWSKNDWISSRIDVHNLAKNLKSLKGKFRVTDFGFNHMDYMFAKQAPELIYNKIISLMTRH